VDSTEHGTRIRLAVNRQTSTHSRTLGPGREDRGKCWYRTLPTPKSGLFSAPYSLRWCLLESVIAIVGRTCRGIWGRGLQS
jgi:hypothetical protein